MTLCARPSAFLISISVCAIALAACDGGDGMDERAMAREEAEMAKQAAPPAPPPAPGMAAADMERVTVTGSRFAGNAAPYEPAPDAGAGAGPDTGGAQPEGMLLAYSYSVGFELPARNVAAMREQHEAECRAAGPRLCLVLGGSVSGDGEDYVYGNLSIRAEPEWLAGFRDGLAEDAEEADGRIADSSTSTEDLTRSIVDTEARLRAQETLRERLIALLERPSDEIDDLLAVERELARVQGQIDSARSTLAVMRARVDMSRLDLSYRAAPRAVSSAAVNPVVVALRDFLTVLSGSLATVITIIAAAIPFVVILIPLILLTWRWFRRRRTRA